MGSLAGGADHLGARISLHQSLTLLCSSPQDRVNVVGGWVAG